MKNLLSVLFIGLAPFVCRAEAFKSSDELYWILLLVILPPILILGWIYYAIWKKCHTKFRLIYLIGIPLFLLLMLSSNLSDYFPILTVFLPILLISIGIIDATTHKSKKN